MQPASDRSTSSHRLDARWEKELRNPGSYFVREFIGDTLCVEYGPINDEPTADALIRERAFSSVKLTSPRPNRSRR